jgi:transcriptional regulator with XRE-family HTH domain
MNRYLVGFVAPGELAAPQRGGHEMGTDISFGRLVRMRRRALDLTQEALARQVGYSVITIRKVESDERRPSRQLVVRALLLRGDASLLVSTVVKAVGLTESAGVAPDRRAAVRYATGTPPTTWSWPKPPAPVPHYTLPDRARV